jgi:hypothetical protein
MQWLTICDSVWERCLSVEGLSIPLPLLSGAVGHLSGGKESTAIKCEPETMTTRLLSLADKDQTTAALGWPIQAKPQPN